MHLTDFMLSLADIVYAYLVVQWPYCQQAKQYVQCFTNHANHAVRFTALLFCRLRQNTFRVRYIASIAKSGKMRKRGNTYRCGCRLVNPR